jgi:hypothetical protein
MPNCKKRPMNKILAILLLLFSTNLFAQESNDSQILNVLLAPSINIKADSVFNEKGEIVKTKPTVNDLVVMRQTSDISETLMNFDNLLKDGLSNLDKSTFLDFKNQNTTTSKIDSLQISNTVVLLIESADAKKIIKKNKWDLFEKKYPNAKLIISISKIGYSIDKKQALLFTTNNNYLGGNYGFFSLYKRIDNEWKIDQSTMVFLDR